jgi:hypothetical protein
MAKKDRRNATPFGVGAGAASERLHCLVRQSAAIGVFARLGFIFRQSVGIMDQNYTEYSRAKEAHSAFNNGEAVLQVSQRWSPRSDLKRALERPIAERALLSRMPWTPPQASHTARRHLMA